MIDAAGYQIQSFAVSSVQLKMDPDSMKKYWGFDQKDLSVTLCSCTGNML